MTVAGIYRSTGIGPVAFKSGHREKTEMTYADLIVAAAATGIALGQLLALVISHLARRGADNRG